MHETQQTISDWVIATFGYPKIPEIIIIRMIKECHELENKLRSGPGQKGYEEYADERADIVICAYHAMTTLGYNLHSCVDHKMQINRARKWKLNGDGTGQHIKD